MLTMQRQGDSECMLATIAMLTDTPLDVVRTFACGEAGVVEWAHLFTGTHREQVEKRNKFHRVVRLTAHHFGGYQLMDAVGGEIAGQPNSGKVREMPLTTRKLPAKGRGTVRFQWGVRQAHIMPWENGMIYDSADGQTYTLAEYRRANPRAKLWALRIFLDT